MPRYATIDIGTNTVLLLVAEKRGVGFEPILERAEITRLGKGVDATGQLDPAAIDRTVKVVAGFADLARKEGATEIACVATSAARDAGNGKAFFDECTRRAGLTPEVISGDEEARLVFLSARNDFAADHPLTVVDVGGGSTEIIHGLASPDFRCSLQMGAVRLTERLVRNDPPTPTELKALRAAVADAVVEARVPRVVDARLIGVAGTVTTLASLHQGLERYDATRVHRSTLSREEIESLWRRLASMKTTERAALKGMEPKRADVIVAGCTIILELMVVLDYDELTVSDRGVRWGLLHSRFG